MKKKVFRTLLVVMLAGYAGYCALAQYGFLQGQAAFEAKDWLTAWEHFEQVGGFYKFALPSHTSEALKWKKQSSLLLFGQSMREKGDYESALDAYISFIVLFPETESASKVSAMLAPTMLEWTQNLHQNKQFAKEIEVLGKLITNYKNTPESQQASQGIITAYNSLGRQLMKDKSFILSIQTFNDAKEFALDEESKTVMDAGYKDAIQGLATDTGIDGLQVISEATKTVCAGQPASSPAVGMLKDAPGKGIFCGDADQFSMPNELIPSMPGEFKYVVSIDYSIDTIQTCLYTGTHVLFRKKRIATITVSSAVTGMKINNNTLFGSEPEYCPPEYGFGTSSIADDFIGSEVADNDIVSWLKTIFEQ